MLRNPPITTYPEIGHGVSARLEACVAPFVGQAPPFDFHLEVISGQSFRPIFAGSRKCERSEGASRLGRAKIGGLFLAECAQAPSALADYFGRDVLVLGKRCCCGA